MKVALSLAVMGYLLTLTAMAQARTYIVDGGSAAAQDANPGTAAQSFETIQHAAAAVQGRLDIA